LRDLEPFKGQVTEVDSVICPGVDGDGIAGGAAADAGALDPREADRFGDDDAAIIRGIEGLDFAAGTSGSIQSD
jgi:hypothetical protein